MAKLKLDLTNLRVDSFDPAPLDAGMRGTVLARASVWGLCTTPDGSCAVFCSYNQESCYGSCDTVCLTCRSCDATCYEPGCTETQKWSCEGTTCVATCAATCAATCDCTVPDTCPCI